MAGPDLRFLSLLIFCSFFFFTACKSKQKIKKPDENANQNLPDSLNDKCHLDYKNGRALTKLVKENELDFTYANSKFSCDLSIDNEDHSFSVSVRCRKDSMIWMSISKLGIDAARVLITKDSVKFTMGLTEKKYFKGDFSYINQLLHADLDYDMIQALLFGNSAQFYDEEDRLNPGKDRNNCQYLLSTTRKKHALRINNGVEQPKESYQTMWISPNSFKITQLEFNDVDAKRKFNACYEDFKPVDRYTAAYKLLYTITAEKIIKADVKYSKITINEVQKFPFTIPSSYEPIEFKKQQ
ncbi:MAG: DUF4292 domain-containing protein [Bacteroidia bacterium]